MILIFDYVQQAPRNWWSHHYQPKDPALFRIWCHLHYHFMSITWQIFFYESVSIHNIRKKWTNIFLVQTQSMNIFSMTFFFSFFSEANLSWSNQHCLQQCFWGYKADDVFVDYDGRKKKCRDTTGAERKRSLIDKR